MKNNIQLEKLYNTACEKKDALISSENFSEEDLLEIILTLSFPHNTPFITKNDINISSISDLLSFYQEELSNNFTNDYIKFKTLFNIYLLIIELFTALCIVFSSNKDRRIYIHPILDTLKESKNMIKFLIPFEEKELRIINNLIGEQLYYLTHVEYIHVHDNDLNYVLEKYLFRCEQIQHGFDFSTLNNFGDNEYKRYDIEEMIYINNFSFLLLKMTHKLSYFKPNETYFQNKHFVEIMNLFKKTSSLNKNTYLKSMDVFHNALIEEFNHSAKYLKNKKNYNMWNEKIKLLALDTDEYKQLIDIISTLK